MSILINIQEKDSNVILGNKTRVVYGKGEMIDDLLGYKFILSYKSFFQINRTQTEKLYNVAKEYANLKGNETVLDAYCGVGTIGITLSKNAKKVYGIEIVPEAIENAKAALGDGGRIVVRPSGTEPLIRVMAEGDDRKLIEKTAKEVAAVIKKQLS